MKIVSIFALALLTSCATCERHPTACAVAGTLVAGAVIASIGAAQWHETTFPRPLPQVRVK